MATKEFRLLARSDREWERVVYAELLIPETPNVFGDYWTPEAIREAMYLFARQGFGIDVDHDNNDVRSGGGAYVVESFIARENDPDFIEGSWVIGMRIEDDAIWQAVLNNEINGYSYEALVEFMNATFSVVDSGVRTGTVEPVAGGDGHVHTFMAIVDENGKVISGGTDEVDGHSHLITEHTITDEAEGHTHRFNLVSGKDGESA